MKNQDVILSDSFEKIKQEIENKYKNNPGLEIIFKKNIDNVELLIKIKYFKNTKYNPFYNKTVLFSIELDDMFPDSIPIIQLTSNVNY